MNTNYIEELNESQCAAVTYNDGPSLVIAGAGSGKTRVLTYKIAYLLENGYQPWNILALTFTNKAAREMKDRIARQVGMERARYLWMGTFHSVFSRILRAEAKYIGFTSQFTIYDSADSKSLIRSIIKEMGLDEKTYKPGMVQARISSAKNHLVSPTGYAANKEAYEGDMAAKVPAVREIYTRYWERCRQAGAMDFDDLLVYTYILFRDFPEVLARYREQFRYVLVDEYQDTNYAQHSIVLQLTKENQRVCVVGDDAQSIYSFRGADIDNILYFTKVYPNTKVFKLEQNYRSTKNILNAANEVIKHNKGRKTKKLWTENEEGDLIEFHQYGTEYEEARKIIHEIEDLSKEGYDYKNMAILYRTNAQSRVFEESFMIKNIPYRIVGGTNFYQRKEVKDILSYLKVVNGLDDLAVRRIINVPRRGIGAATIEKINVYAVEHNISFLDACFSADSIDTLGNAKKKINGFADLIREFRRKMQEGSLEELFKYITDETGYIANLKAEETEEAEGRIENINELLNKVVTYEQEAEEASLSELLEEIALVADIDNLEDSDNRVVLMTLHSAKGLEFPYVFICGMEDGIFPSYMTVMSEDDDDMEEERRLCYVGITRAKKKLYLSAAKRRMMQGRTQFNKVSRFIDEIPEQLLQLDTGVNFKEKRPDKALFSSNRSNRFRKPYQAKSFTSTKMDTLPYDVGDMVKHIKFGKGKVLEIVSGGRDYEVTVDFEKAGVKKMFASFAKLKKVE